MFMGDTGSLALGGALAAMAILTKTELLLILAGGLYVIEALSVIIQVISFKTRGVRVFKMSPIHHHLNYLAGVKSRSSPYSGAFRLSWQFCPSSSYWPANKGLRLF